MAQLPSGTVSLLFSDIEGSTALLSRLGAAYTDALDGQRQVLRKAWAGHGGIELGTEGDSFFVVFDTAEGAVAAAVQAQRDLSAFDWPGGERVRVRMGIHTGTPQIHEDSYVGMDVHRAARIAAAAHGGQVVLSEPTARLIDDCLPERVGLRDLGSHQLKDIPRPERLFQLAIDGLGVDFPPLKTLGAASRLPRPATPLVGRDGELAELSALLRSPQVRLVTLTGPGGTGKTRLGIALAQRLVERFPDGVYFVPLGSVTTSDVMWTSIAEVLDMPPEARMPPEFFALVRHRSSLVVLDNLEQIEAADGVVATLMDEAPQMVVIATSRRPLHVSAEHEHPVPPLRLPPPDGTVAEAELSSAVQLFVHHARKVRAGFQLTAGNAADVIEVCRQLDGLPLAIELVAARTKLLSPAALRARLDKALDLATASRQVPSRQRTLRDTIAWSHDLLDATQQAFFRRLGVFAGGADLEAIAALNADLLGDADPVDFVADLVDQSLATVAEDHRGEPRVGMLQTVRTYALDQLRAAGDLDSTRQSHAEYYLSVAERLHPELVGRADQVLSARERFEAEHDNLREALTWALAADGANRPTPERVTLGLRLCTQMERFWADSGYSREGVSWLQRAISLAPAGNSLDLASGLHGLAALATDQGDQRLALDSIRKSVAMRQQLGGDPELASALRSLAWAEMEHGDLDASRRNLDEAIAAAKQADDQRQVAIALCVLADVEAYSQNFKRAIELYDAAQELSQRVHDDYGALTTQHNRACTLREMGRLADAERDFADLVTQALRIYNPAGLVTVAEDYAAVLAELGEHQQALRLLGAAEAMRERNSNPRPQSQEAEIGEPFAKVRAALSDDDWNHEYRAGYTLAIADALTEAQTTTQSRGGR
ncbi:MAG TPA: tetratricopeptide repeat protein [Nocardioidaceae bacterium]|nr:tetratricopeptide repeat protein [Nocardioidaceae bacterium]